MPNPFENEEHTPTQAELYRAYEKAKTFSGKAVSGSLTCDICFEINEEGMYYPDSKRLDFFCEYCGSRNSIRDIELNI